MSDHCLIWSPLTVIGCRLSVVAVVEVSKMSDRSLYQSEAEELVLERGLVIAELEVPFSRFQGPLFEGLWNPGHRIPSQGKMLQ